MTTPCRLRRSVGWSPRLAGPAGVIAAALVLLAGCMTPPVPDRGVNALLEGLGSARTCGQAAQFARDLQFWGNQHDPQTIREVVNMIRSGQLCEEARLELVRVLELAQARQHLPEMIDCLDDVSVKESKLADELAALIVDFSTTYDEVFGFIRKHITSSHVTLRYGCVDLLKTYFRPGVKPIYANEIVDLLVARVKEEKDAAVAELACAALGEIGLGADTERRPEIKALLEDVSNHVQRKFPEPGVRGKVPQRFPEDVRRMAVDYSYRLGKS
jgi:hypothetical protein